VTTNRKITIAEWRDPQDPAISQQARPHRRFLPPAVIGLAGTLALHTLALRTVVLGSRAHQIRPPEIQEPGSLLSKSEAKPADALVFIDLPHTLKTTDGLDEALASVRAAIKDGPIPVTQPDPSPPRDLEVLALSDDKNLESSVDSGDGAERARLFGIYAGQIQARIERVWRRPRTPVEERGNTAKSANAPEYFHCQAQIVQDSIGNVQEILLPNCNGSVAWQRSLVLAIQQASPLPAPPSPKVFSHSMMLEFIGNAYNTGSSEGDYEIAPIKAVETLSTLPARPPPQAISDVSSILPITPLSHSERASH
jgi:hypothetical protein